MKIYQNKEKLTKLYEEFKSGKKVANHLNVNEKTIYTWLKKLGIDTSQTGSQGARKNNLNHDYFKKIDSEDKAYWLGFIMADGCVYVGSNHTLRLQINLASSDLDHLNKFQEAIESSYKIQIKKVNQKNEVAILKINSTELCKDLQNLGVVFRKSLICEMPNIPNELMKHFIRGYFDGDGCITTPKNKNTKVTIVGGEKMMKSIKDFLKKENIFISLHNPYKGKKTFTLETQSKKNVTEFLRFLYDDASIYLDRKYFLYKKFLEKSKPVPLNSDIK